MKKMYKISRLLFTAAVVSLLAGCSTGKAPQVIGEKPSSSQAAPEQPIKGGVGPGESKSTDGGGVRGQVQAPEHFQAEVKEDAVIVLADAPVTVPDVGQLGVKKANAVNFTEEEYQRVKDALADEMKIGWKAGLIDTEDDSPSFKTVAEEGRDDKGVNYRISYRTTIGESVPISSLIWVTRLIPEGRSSSRPAYICAADDNEAVSRSAKAKELEKKTGELLKAAGFEHYRQYRGMWRRSFYTINGKEQTEMEYIITYTPVVDGVGCTENAVNLFATSYLYGPYIEVYYDEDGTFNQLKIIDKEAVEDSTKTEDFLLPFESINELFIQYCKDFFRKNSGTDTSVGAKTGENSLSGSGLQPVVTVKNVKLEYAFLQKEGGQPDEMELAPVWNFYGSIKKGYVSQDGSVKSEDYWTARQEPEGLILSIRADDGQILAD